MKPIIHLKSISEITNFVELTTKHPLAAVVDFSKIDEKMEEGTSISCDFYSITTWGLNIHNILVGFLNKNQVIRQTSLGI